MRYEIETRTVSIKNGGDTVQAYLATPRGRGTFPGLIVIHEWWGLNDWVRSQADALAREGYVALAVDLYRGRVTTDPMEAH
ncbi:MAG: dienelactone hydrolase family protein, partial [Armatimonadetes bacterium]|nr:dienelactone hydrolase family protein [Armatimonadota bacterium]